MTQESWTPYIWGKTDRGDPGNTGLFLWLPCHLLNVGEMARAFLRHPEAGHWRARLAASLGCDLDRMIGPLSLLIGLHDIGKAGPQFQKKSPAHWQRLQELGAPVIDAGGPLHAAEGQCFLEKWLEDPASSFVYDKEQSYDFAGRLALAIGGHHGRFGETPKPQVRYEPKPGNHSQIAWASARRSFVALVAERLLDGDPPLRCQPENLSVACLLLNGLSILSDWLGSDEKLFPPGGPVDWNAYAEHSRAVAERVATTRGLLHFLPGGPEPSFTGLFPSVPSPRPLQRALEPDALPDLPEPGLLLVEGPMGEGKTEAALLLARRYAARGAASGFYFGLPTMATSNQMFTRVLEYLEQWAPEDIPVGALLVNGRAEFNPAVRKLLRVRTSEEAQDVTAPEEQDRGENRVTLDSWLLPRKRSLLAPYGVGTVDQAMFAAMNVPHVGLRLLGLAGRVVIIDEVHAYDLYMTEILENLLKWLRALGSPVILLSATLAAEQRTRLLKAYDIQPTETVAEPPYPCLISGKPGEEAQVRSLGEGSRPLSVTLEMRRAEQGWTRDQTAAELLSRIEGGGCAAWICNTVAEAQEAWKAVQTSLAAVAEADRPVVLLYHARFLLEDREELEREVVSRFGGKGQRPRSALLIGTQVLEQSLNYDVDVMATELAPVDLLLQRLGRLWRFAETERPAGLAAPHLLVLVPQIASERPRFLPYGAFYQPFILLKTLAALHDLPAAGDVDTKQLRLPDEIRRLVERVYDGRCMDEQVYHGRAESQAIEEATGVGDVGLKWADTQKKEGKALREAAAKLVLFGEPDTSGFFLARDFIRTSDDEADSVATVAMATRWGEPSARLVLLDHDDPLLTTGGLSRKGASLSEAEIERLLLRSVTVQKRALTDYLYPEDDSSAPCYPPQFAAVNALRGYRLIRLKDGAWDCPDGGLRLRLVPELGVVIDKENA